MIQWSQQYYELTEAQHRTNNMWFDMMLSCLNDNGTLYVPDIDKTFNKQGEEIQ